MKKLTFLAVIAIVFIAGSITSSTLVSATTTIDPLTLFKILQNEINKLKSSTQSVINFSYGAAGEHNGPTSFIGTGVSYPNISNNIAIVMPVNGTISHLAVTTTIAPSTGQHFTFTILKNGIDTSLKCTISNLDTSCTDPAHSFQVTTLDRIIERVDSSALSNDTNVESSVAFTSR